MVTCLTCSPLLLSRKPGMGLCSCLTPSCMSSLLAVEGKLSLCYRKWSVDIFLTVRAATSVPSWKLKLDKQELNTELFSVVSFGDLRTLSVFPRSMTYDLLVCLANLCPSKICSLGQHLTAVKLYCSETVLIGTHYVKSCFQ